MKFFKYLIEAFIIYLLFFLFRVFGIKFSRKFSSCPLPQTDTVRVTIIVEPPTNKDPYFINQKDTNYVSVPWNSNFSTEIIGLDDDMDSLSIEYFVHSVNNYLNLGFFLEERK